MRTTVELRDDQRARLLALAARRGQKGFSLLVQDAVDRYLEEEELRGRALQDALGALGSLSPEAGEGLQERVADLRRRWR